MTLWQVASSSLVALLTLASAASAQRVELKVPVAPAPQLDRGLADAAWEAGVKFDIVRDKELYASVRLLRAGRELYVGYRSEFKPLALGLRLHFVDPETARTVAVLVAPLDLPRAPLSAWLMRRGEEPARLDASGAQLRFDFSPEIGFSFVASLPLDLLEIGRPAKRFQFNVELWDTEARRPLGFYPSASGAGGGKQPSAVLEPTTDWGVDVPASAADPVKNEALALLGQIAKGAEKQPEGGDAVKGGDAISAYMGLGNGRRSDAPLAKLETQLRKQIEVHRDYAALYANLVRVLIGRNDHAGALEVLHAMRKQFPDLARDGRQALAVLQMLRDSGKYAEARAWLNKHDELLRGSPAYTRESVQLDALVAAWTAEQAYRDAEAKRGDLPRVKFETNRGAFVVELFEDDAPNSVANLIQLVSRGFYDGTRFHWATASASVMGGDPNSRDDDPFNDGFGDPGYLIEPEQSKRSNFPYTMSMLPKRRSNWTMGCSFAINLTPATDRDGRIVVVGRVVEGFDVVRRLGYYDTLKKATVIRKRDHVYEVVKRSSK